MAKWYITFHIQCITKKLDIKLSGTRQRKHYEAF